MAEFRITDLWRNPYRKELGESEVIQRALIAADFAAGGFPTNVGTGDWAGQARTKRDIRLGRMQIPNAFRRKGRMRRCVASARIELASRYMREGDFRWPRGRCAKIQSSQKIRLIFETYQR